MAIHEDKFVNFHYCFVYRSRDVYVNIWSKLTADLESQTDYVLVTSSRRYHSPSTPEIELNLKTHYKQFMQPIINQNVRD